MSKKYGILALVGKNGEKMSIEGSSNPDTYLNRPQ